MPKFIFFIYIAAATLIGLSTTVETLPRIIAIALAISLLVLPKGIKWYRSRKTAPIKRSFILLKSKAFSRKPTSSESQPPQDPKTALEMVLNGESLPANQSIPEDVTDTLKKLQHLVYKNYRNLTQQRMVLGENTIDWQVELLRLAERELDSEQLYTQPITRAQMVQAMNSHLRNLMRDEASLKSKVA
ncbi:hypothetical protein [Pleionea sediminis]|uniref:hypothetical protein n=1 Tax=Pleionea sediminis TaxID=2569479 RepID=UPI0011861B56|nr:hypothetical protein [Pleionea sediminis]